MNFKNTLKSSVAVAALLAISTPMTSHADDTLSSGNKNSLKISGQVVKAVSRLDNNSQTSTSFSDGAWTQSRIRWVASGKLSDSITVGAAVEMNFPLSNNASGATLGVTSEEGTADATAWGMRHTYIHASSKEFGKVYLGQTSTAADGSNEASYTGTGIFAGSAGASYGSGVAFVNTTTVTQAKAASTVTVAKAISNLDHGSRADIIRYDLPKFMGISAKTSVKPNGDWDLGLAYSGSLDGLNVKARAGLTETPDSVNVNRLIGGSIALEMDGLWASLAGGKKQIGMQPQEMQENSRTYRYDTNGDGVQDPHFFHVGVGYNTKIFAAGKTGFTINYGEYKELADSGLVAAGAAGNHDRSEAEVISLQAVQNFNAIGASVGFEYANYQYEDEALNVKQTYDDIDAVTLMTVFKF